MFWKKSSGYKKTGYFCKSIMANFTNTKYKEEGYFNAPGNGNGNAIFVLGNYGYMASGNKFYIFDLDIY